jgi:hypothetical protein
MDQDGGKSSLLALPGRPEAGRSPVGFHAPYYGQVARVLAFG